MIEPSKLFQLEAGQRRRKLALTFGALERDILGIAERGNEYAFHSLSRVDYIKKLVTLVSRDEKISANERSALSSFLQAEIFDERRACNFARNALLKVLGSSPSEWDLIVAPHESAKSARETFSNTFVFAEDIRSPFNLGSLFRTAEACGLEKMFLSTLCCDENSARAKRSAMGCIETLPHERLSLTDTVKKLPADFPIFALETGGTPIDQFAFPREGLCLVGSEELGLSVEALHTVNAGIVSIPMKGFKSSLNFAVAFGILLSHWLTETRK